MDKYAINVENLIKTYNLYKKPRDRIREAFSRKTYHEEFNALDDVSFRIREGECFGIIGKNGSGKSTLLKIITGVLSKTAGIVDVEGRISALLELGAGFNMEYTGIENLYLNGNIMGYTKEEMEERIPEILDFADIGDYVYQPVKTYSSGMFVRLAFAMAINVEPEILIVDEALSVGDAFFQLKCYKKFTDFKKAGKTIVFVTHDLSSVIKYCDRVMVLNNGKKVDEGEARDMVDLYKKILVGQDQENESDNKDLSRQKIELQSNVELTEKIIEYGTKEAIITEVHITNGNDEATTQIDKFDELSISFKIIFNKEILDPIVAFTLKDIKGTEICGTNNMFEGMEGFKTKPGEVYLVTFRQNIPLQGGYYFVSLGCTGMDLNGNFNVYHRLYDVVEINIVSDKDTVGYFDLNSEVKIEKWKDKKIDG